MQHDELMRQIRHIYTAATQQAKEVLEMTDDIEQVKVKLAGMCWNIAHLAKIVEGLEGRRG